MNIGSATPAATGQRSDVSRSGMEQFISLTGWIHCVRHFRNGDTAATEYAEFTVPP